MVRKFLVLLIPLWACAAEPPQHFDGQSWWNTVKVLADDKFEGRETGSTGAGEPSGITLRRTMRTSRSISRPQPVMKKSSAA